MSDRTTYIMNHDLPARVYSLHWRVGGQLGRTVYAHDEDNDYFIGLFDSRKFAEHICHLQNAWADRVRAIAAQEPEDED